MMSMYMSAVMSTLMVTAITLYSIDESQRPPAMAINAPALNEAHAYAVNRGNVDYPPVLGQNNTHEVSMGPFFSNDTARSFVKTYYNPLITFPSELYKTSHLTWFVPQNHTEALRVSNNIDTDEDTWVEIYNGRPTGVPLLGKTIPNIGVTIPLGAVIIVTEEIGDPYS